MVYKALDSSLHNRPVALKVLHPHLLVDPTFVQRFQQEAGAAANLRHPNVVVVHEVGELEGTYYIAMEYLPGTPLDELVKDQGPLALGRAVEIIGQIASALDYAHEKGFIHRDVKSGNIIVGHDDHATLTDFGLVRAAEGTMLTSTGRILGALGTCLPNRRKVRSWTTAQICTPWRWWPTRCSPAACPSRPTRPLPCCEATRTNHRPDPPN